jgi:hypothetical protein
MALFGQAWASPAGSRIPSGPVHSSDAATEASFGGTTG